MKVLPSHTGEVTAARSEQAASTPTATASSASFASQLASATAPGTDVTMSTPSTPAAPKAISLHKGEAMTAVNGHSYAEIHGGKRDGLYVNTSNNKRRGQAFVLVHKHGREYHIYGTGKNRLVVALRKPEHSDPQKKASTDTQPMAPSNTAAGTGGVTPTVSAS